MAPLTRRRFLGSGLAGLLGWRALSASALAKETSLANPFDREIEGFMSPRGIPGGALAVVKERRLVYARGYGFADREQRAPVQTDSLFRIASLSKPITAVAILRLVEEGKLDLEARALDLLSSGPDALPTPADERWSRITVRHLLQHTAGFDRDRSFDPMFRPREIAAELGIASPPGPAEIVRYMLAKRLDFDPGTRHAYSNFGYCVLGRILERTSGLGYERLVQQSVLEPIGIRRMRLGRSLEDQRAEAEARYYTGEDRTESVFDDHRSRVPWPYGGFCLEALDAHGGWLASAVDLARFAAALHDPSRSPLLKRETIELMHAPPPPPAWRDPGGGLADYYYACGWLVRPVSGTGRANVWHNGSLPGSYTLLVRRWDGLSWVGLFNRRSETPPHQDVEIDLALHRAADAVAEWPAHDLFAE